MNSIYLHFEPCGLMDCHRYRRRNHRPAKAVASHQTTHHCLREGGPQLIKKCLLCGGPQRSRHLMGMQTDEEPLKKPEEGFHKPYPETTTCTADQAESVTAMSSRKTSLPFLGKRLQNNLSHTHSHTTYRNTFLMLKKKV